MYRWAIAACAMAALVAVPSATPQTIVGRTVAKSFVLRAGATKSLSIACPRGYFALSAGASKAGDGVAALAARPLGLRTFGFRFSNAGKADQRVAVVAACRKVQSAGARHPYLRLRTLHRVTMSVPAAAQRQAHLTCPSGTVPAAAGFDVGRGDLSVRQERQDLHMLSFGVFNLGHTARTASFYGSCLTVVRPHGARGAQLQVSLATDTVPIPTGPQVVNRVCPRGWLSLAAGYSLPGGLDLNGAAAIGRAGRWSFTNHDQKPVLAEVQLVCGRLS
jgi:hypothetical protein